MKTKTNFNSTVNQSIKSKFVDRNVICNMNQMIDFIANVEDKQGWYDEFMQLFCTPDYETTIENEGWCWNNEQGEYTHEDYEETFEDAEDICQEYNLDYEWLEPYEFWSVTRSFAKDLEDRGHIVVEILGHNIWGRCTTGQAILLDYVVSDICNDLEILEGQKYSWE